MSKTEKTLVENFLKNHEPVACPDTAAYTITALEAAERIEAWA